MANAPGIGGLSSTTTGGGGSTSTNSTIGNNSYRSAWWGKGVLFAAFYCDQPGGFQLSDLVLQNTNNYKYGALYGFPTQNPAFYPFMSGEPISQVKVEVKYGPGFSNMGQLVPGLTYYKQPAQFAFYTGVNGLVFFVGNQPHIDNLATWIPGFYIAKFSILDSNGGAVETKEVTFYYDPNSSDMSNHIVKVCFNKPTISDPRDEPFLAQWLIPLDPSQVANNLVSKVTYSVWPSNLANLSTFVKCTQSVDNENIILRIADDTCSSCLSDKLFDISYGDDLGSGSVDLGGNDFYTVANAVYGQYRGLFLESAGPEVKFDLSGSSFDYFYSINIKQDLLRNSLDVGTFELNLAHLSGSQFVGGGESPLAYTGSNVTLAGDGALLRLIDSSRYLEPAFYSGTSPVYYLISGSLENGPYQTDNPTLYGLLHPKLGTVILSGPMLDASASFGTVRSPDVAGDNPDKLLLSISGAAQYSDASGDVCGFKARCYELEYNILTYIRVGHNQLNLSNNPTYVVDELGTVSPDFINHPKVFMTTIGLYNDNKELVAVGKISRPILRTGSDQAFFKVRLKQ